MRSLRVHVDMLTSTFLYGRFSDPKQWSVVWVRNLGLRIENSVHSKIIGLGTVQLLKSTINTHRNSLRILLKGDLMTYHDDSSFYFVKRKGTKKTANCFF